MYRTKIPAQISARLSWLHTLFFNKWFFDEVYEFLIVKNASRLGRVFWFAGDQNTIDRLGPDGSAKASVNIAHVLSKFQSGFVFQYAFVMMIALIGLLSWFVFKLGQGW
jgi:NADH-quinone oxidoreductase subunit L